jgi:hypothetical protein
MRVENPRKLAAVLLAEDRGWSPEKVAQAISGGGEHTLDKPIPVHVTYLTAVVDENGRVASYGDIYGHDSRLWSAMTGKALRVEPAVETASSDDGGYDPQPATVTKRKGKKKPSYSGPESLADAISGLLAN